MRNFCRRALRLRRILLRSYEVTLYTLLLALAIAVVLPASPADAEDASPQCGNIQSSALVITR